MTQRTDPHRPGAIIPADYDYKLSYSLATVIGNWPVPAWNVDLAVEKMRAAIDAGHRVFGGCGKCGSCGAVYIYGDLWEHRPTGDLLHVGHVCADKYQMMADRSEFELAMGRRNQAAAREIAKAENAERRKAFFAENPGLEEALALDHPILQDLASKLGRWGLSEKQVALALKIANEIKNPKPEEAHVPAPEGRIDFEGTIVSVKYHETDFGTVAKMTVKVQTEAGSWLAWGTCPALVIDEAAKIAPTGTFAAMRGLRVALRATLKRGRDHLFAIMSRPSGRLTPEGAEALKLAVAEALERERAEYLAANPSIAAALSETSTEGANHETQNSQA